MRDSVIEFFKDYRVILLIVLLIGSVASISVLGIQEGLDLKGGSQIQIHLEKPVDQSTMNTVTSVLDKRLNAFGVKDVQVRASGDQDVIVDIAGVKPDQVANLVGTPGKFEAKIGNDTVLVGSDIVTVKTYSVEGNTWHVPFTITTEAANKFAQLANGKAGQPVNMYLDGNLVSSPTLDPGLANGVASTDVEVSGSENSSTQAQDQAKNIQTILQSGALPVSVSITGISSVSATLGEQFKNGALIAGVLALIVISIIIFIRYREPKLVIPIIFTSLAELILILGVASVIRWNIDLAAIAGIIAAIGTGVDDQIIITDEVLKSKSDLESKPQKSKKSKKGKKGKKGKKAQQTGDKKVKVSKRITGFRVRIRSAFFIIYASAATLIAAMLPIAYIGFTRGTTGIGVLIGFAFTTIIGVLIGIFITRPVYAKFIELIYGK
ncbi:MAG TPA: preprotein translocase subunit SecD [Methanobacterium sp.]|nr:preprotein translocase subunit SecD [Methanobacterium sp.]